MNITNNGNRTMGNNILIIIHHNKKTSNRLKRPRGQTGQPENSKSVRLTEKLLLMTVISKTPTAR